MNHDESDNDDSQAPRKRIQQYSEYVFVFKFKRSCIGINNTNTKPRMMLPGRNTTTTSGSDEMAESSFRSSMTSTSTTKKSNNSVSSSYGRRVYFLQSKAAASQPIAIVPRAGRSEVQMGKENM